MGVRTLLLLAKLLFLDLASPEDAPPDGQAFVFLGHVNTAVVDEHLLLDAVAIYTRDLGIALLQSPGKQPPGLSPTSLDDVVALLRARGARWGFWCQLAPGGKQIELVTIDTRRTIARYPFDPESAPRSDLYRSMALRLRVTLVGADNGEAAAASPAGGGPSQPASPAPLAPVAPRPSEPPEISLVPPAAPPSKRESAAEGAPRAEPPRTRALEDGASRLSFGAGYALSYPLGTSGGAAARNALALEVIVGTHAHLEWNLTTDLAPAADRTSAVATISVLDIPLRFGGRWLEEVGPLIMGGGPFLGLHWLSADASAGTRTDHRTAFGGAGGVDLMARGPIIAGFAPQLRVWAELDVPRTRFTIQGVPNYDVGTVRLGLNIEVVAPAR